PWWASSWCCTPTSRHGGRRRWGWPRGPSPSSTGWGGGVSGGGGGAWGRVGAHCAGGVVSLGSLVGFVTVLGIAARNGILMVSHFRHLEAEEGVAFGDALVLRGAEERLSPILMTALATGLALL